MIVCRLFLRSALPFPRLALRLCWILVVGGLVLGAPPGRAQETKEPAANPDPLTPQEKWGKQIYLTGESPSGEPVVALMGESGVEVPASTLPCGNCHGRDGKGNPEGGIDPSNLTWEALTKPYGVRHGSGREHPAYTVRSLKRAIAMGLDPAGNELHAAMPRYRMTLEDMDAVVAYLQRLGADPDPGVEREALHLATLLPPAGVAGGVGEAIESVLRAFVAEVNERGGLYSRRLILHVHRLLPEPERRRADLEAFLDQTPVFAMVGAFLARSDETIPRLLEERQIPLVGPFTLHPQFGFPINRQVFYLLSGLSTQGRVLVDFAAERQLSQVQEGDAEPAALVVFSPDPSTEEAVQAIERQAERQGWRIVRHSIPSASPGATAGSPPLDGEPPAKELAKELAEAGGHAVILLDPDVVTESILTGLAPAEVYVPGVFANVEVFDSPPAVAERLFLALPSLPTDRSPQAIEKYRALAKKHGLPPRNLNTQLLVLAAAEVLREGLEQAGREVSREKLIAALEGLYEYRTGLVPPLTFNPNRHIGALGAYVVTLDPEHGTLRPVGGFREPEGRR